MKRIYWIIQLLFITACCCSAANGQGSDSSKKVLAKLTSFSDNHPVEKAYLQFDKPYYAAGDTIYFKAYLAKGEQHHLSDISGVLHVELINTGNKIDQSLKLRLDSGITWGDFALPDSLPAGNYRIRAYTQLMRNNGETDFFYKTIPVASLKAQKIPESLIKQTQRTGAGPDIQFFPEAGSLVAGIRSKVAFKAISQDGLGVDVKGTIVDNANNEIASFSSAHLGMGYFYLKPAEGNAYSAKITWPGGRQEVIALPTPVATGIVMSVDNDSIPKASVHIETSPDYYRRNRNKEYTLLVYSQGLATAVSCKLDSQSITLCILKRKLRTGVATVTLFSPENEPLSERLFFIQNYDALHLEVNSDKETYAQRGKVNIKLNAINRKGDPAEGHFSVSVINENKVPDNKNDADNILSYFLLTSDLKGYIEQPGYYFADASTVVSHNLDLLMLTQGYRRFEWKQVLETGSQALAYLPEKGIEIDGQIRNLFNKPITDGTVTLIPAKGGPVLMAAADDKGMFHFSNLIFTDTAHFVLSAVNSKGRNSTKIAYMNKPGGPAIAGADQQVLQPVSDTAMATYIDNNRKQRQEYINYGKANGIMLKEVKIHEKKPDNQYRTFSLAGAGNADQVMHAEEIERVQGALSTSLNGRLHGINFVGNNPMRKVPVEGYSGAPMVVYIDGAEVPAEEINYLSANDVETVEVLKYASTSIYGMNGGHGVLIITTKQGGRDPKDIASIGVLPIAPMGFYKAREFYSPKYENVSAGSKQRDFRSTIYWKPEIKTGKDGSTSFEYYNADGAGMYKIVVEGIDGNGNLGRQVYRYKVE